VLLLLWFVALVAVSSCVHRPTMQAPAVCQFYGTVAGCRRGKRCQNLHVNDDGGHAKTKASFQTEAALFDSFRNRTMTLMRDYLRQAGSTTEVLGASFRRGASMVRFTVRTAEQPSDVSCLVVAGSLMYTGFRGNGSFPENVSLIGKDIAFYHGTTVHSGMSILTEGMVRAKDSNNPIGFYTTLEPPSEQSLYHQGCIVEVVSVGKLLSVRESSAWCDEFDEVPEGLIVCVKRSVREYIHNPRSLSIAAVTFDTKALTDLCRIADVRLPVRPASSAAASLAVPKAEAVARMAAREAAERPSLLVSKAKAVARMAAREHHHRSRSPDALSAPRTPPRAAPSQSSTWRPGPTAAPPRAAPSQSVSTAPRTPPARPPPGLLWRENNKTAFTPAGVWPITDDWENDDWENSWGKWT